MTISDISEIHNNDIPQQLPILEIMDINVPKIITENISKRNGMIYTLVGSGGSGKTNVLLNFFKSDKLYRKRFHNIFYICPMSSFLSVAKHPFEEHDKVYHELTIELLYEIYDELDKIKQMNIKKKRKPEYSLVIIDDMADVLKDKNLLKAMNKLLIKARHLCTGFIFTLQSFYYFPKILRKQLTYISIFKPKNIEEWYTISKELLNLKKDDALQLYKYVFDELYNHLDIDTITNTYYKNFNKLVITN